MASNFLLLRWALRVWRFFTWLYRKIAPFDYTMALSMFGVTIFLNAAILFDKFFSIINFLALPSIVRTYIEILACIMSVLAVLFAGVFIFRMRIIGVVSVDGSAESGLDYRRALDSISEGFDFLGIGASKLTTQSKHFEDAVQRMAQHQGKVRILLCDPRSAAIGGLERNAGVNAGRYLANVKQSFTLLQHLQGRFPETLEIRLYTSDSERTLPPFRLMFINNDSCLVSQVVIGAPKEGRLVPQMHVYGKSIFQKMPNFYRAYHVLFQQTWDRAASVNFDDFGQIAQIDISRHGVAHA